jgi:hypothetical protein
MKEIPKTHHEFDIYVNSIITGSIPLLVDTSGIIRPIDRASGLTYFISYI